MRQYILGYSGISWTICKQSAPCSRQIATPTPNHSIFTGWMLFLTPNQHCQSTVLPGTTEAKKYCTWCFWRFLRSCSIFCCFSNFSVILASRSDWCFGRLYALQLSAVCNVVSRRMHATTSLRSWTQQIRIHHNSKKQDTIYKKMNLKNLSACCSVRQVRPAFRRTGTQLAWGILIPSGWSRRGSAEGPCNRTNYSCECQRKESHDSNVRQPICDRLMVPNC